MAKKKDELQVIVEQQPGVISWNFEDLKAALAEKLHTYETMVYTEDSVKAAKDDIAALRKLKKAIEDKRKEIKENALAPYYAIEQQAKELVGIIEKPIKKIAEQVDGYEMKRRAAVKAEITAYMKKQFAELPEGIAKKLQFKIYDSRWENSTATKKSWQDAIATALSHTAGDLGILDDIEDDFKGKAMEAYGTNLVLSDALAKVNELRRQREEILERERERIAAEDRRKAEAEERRKAEEAAKAEREARIAEENTRKAEQDAGNPSENAHTAAKADEPPKRVARADVPIPSAVPQAVEAKPTSIAPTIPDGKTAKSVRIIGMPAQINRVLAYIKFTGAAYEEIDA